MSLPPSMSLAVKSRQAFFLGGADRPRRRPPAGPCSRPCCLREHSFPVAALPSPALGEGGDGERMLLDSVPQATRSPVSPSSPRFRSAACLSVRAPGPNDRLSVGARCGPSTLYRIRLGRPARQRSRAHPSNERCLSRFTRRQNGDSLRPRLLPHSGGARTALLPASVLVCPGHVGGALHGYGLRGDLLRVAPCRRVHQQPPVLLLCPRR